MDDDDAKALYQTRRELGPDYEQALADGFAERVEAAIARQLANGVEVARDSGHEAGAALRRQTLLGGASVIAGIPITAVSASIAHLPGLTVCWIGLVAVNAAHAWAARGLRR